MIQAYLIDPFTHFIGQVYFDGTNAHIYELCDFDTFTIVSRPDHPNLLFVDDEGVFKKKQAYFMYRDYPQPLAGKALLTGPEDEDGYLTSPTVPLDWLISNISFLRKKDVVD